MTGLLTVETRCRDGAGCVEVVARIAAAELARHELGFDDEANRLLDAAQRWAEIHHYGLEHSATEPE